MTGAGALDVSRVMTEAETLIYTLDIIGDTLPSEFTWVYDLKGCQSLHLTEGDGITVNDGLASVTITPGMNYRLPPGEYLTGCIVTNKATGEQIQLFDGQLTVVRSANA